MSYGTKKRSRSSFENNDESSEGASSAAVCSTRGSSSFGSVARSGRLDDEDIDDFKCESGISDTLQKYKPASITAQRVNSNFFCCRLDGKQHPTLPTESACQYCHYQYRHVLTDAQRKVNKYQDQNRKHERRCLICNVNLCPSCELEFHGIKASDLGQYFRRK